MRGRFRFGKDRHCVFPGSPTTVSVDTLVLPDVALALAIRHYYLVERYTMRIDFAVDPGSSAGAISTYTLSFPIDRPISAPRGELALFTPGLFEWPGNITAQSALNALNSFVLSGSFFLFRDGWRIPSDIGGPPTDFVRPSFRLHFVGVDSGLDSTFYATTDPVAGLGLGDDAQIVSSTVTIQPPGGVGDPIVTACNFIDNVGSGTSPYIFGGVAPIITLTPALCYERRKADTTAPMHNAVTFALEGNPADPAL